VSENKLLKNILRSKKEVSRKCEKLHNLYSSPTIIIVIKFRRIKWVCAYAAITCAEGQECMQKRNGKRGVK
jgi:hypothetical protein